MLVFLLAGSLFVSDPVADARANSNTLRVEAEFTWGILGPTRQATRYAPRDWVISRLRIHGLQPDKLGNVSYLVRTDLRRPSGVVDSVQRLESGTQNLWRQNTAVLFSQLPLELSQAPGSYALRFHIYDRHSGQEVVAELPFEVAPAGFALLGPLFFMDQAATAPCGPQGQCGQRLFVKVGVVGHAMDKGRSKARCEVEVVTADGEEVYRLESAPLEMASSVLSFDVVLPLVQPGDFTLRLRVRDELTSGQQQQVEVPLKVLGP